MGLLHMERSNFFFFLVVNMLHSMSIVNANTSIILMLSGIFDERLGQQSGWNMTFCAHNENMEISYT